jgi:GntP family gluconate:H+ symporter
MTTSLTQLVVCLTAGILLIIVLTARYRVHAFFALLLACFVVGFGVQMPGSAIIAASKQGFGNIMQSLGLIIVLGTTLGVVLEHTGSTRVMASFILKKAGERRAALAMSITGFIVGLPIFCDSGYIVLSGLNKSMAKRTGTPIAVMAVSLATGLYAVHCLIPPHPGAAAAAGTIGVDFGRLILIGVLAAIPAMIVGYWWAGRAGRKTAQEIVTGDTHEEDTSTGPPVLLSFLPVVVPILLIALKSFLSLEKVGTSLWMSIISFLGDPVIALSSGVLLAFCGNRSWNKDTVSKLLTESAEKAGGILVIIGAGGAFGAVLAATHLDQHFNNAPSLNSLGMLFPFLLTFVLKTAQGSSTVAIITAASIVQPLLPVLGLATPDGQLIAVLSMGAGSMMISHANDAYFWVIARFSGLDMKTMLKVYSVASILMGLVTLLVVYIVSLAIL